MELALKVLTNQDQDFHPLTSEEREIWNSFSKWERSVILTGSPLWMPEWRTKLCAMPGPLAPAPANNPPLRLQYNNQLYLLLRIQLRDHREVDEDQNLLRLHQTVRYDQKGPPLTDYYPNQRGLGLGLRQRPRHLLPQPPLKHKLHQPRLHQRRKTRSPRSRRRRAHPGPRGAWGS